VLAFGVVHMRATAPKPPPVVAAAPPAPVAPSPPPPPEPVVAAAPPPTASAVATAPEGKKHRAGKGHRPSPHAQQHGPKLMKVSSSGT
jgi:hypothetical protein